MRNNIVIAIILFVLSVSNLYGQQKIVPHKWYIGVSVAPVLFEDTAKDWSTNYDIEVGYQTASGWTISGSFRVLHPQESLYIIGNSVIKTVKIGVGLDVIRTYQPNKSTNTWYYLKSGFNTNRAQSNISYISEDIDNSTYTRKEHEWLNEFKLGVGFQKPIISHLFIDVSFVYHTVLHSIKNHNFKPFRTSHEFKIGLKKTI